MKSGRWLYSLPDESYYTALVNHGKNELWACFHPSNCIALDLDNFQQKVHLDWYWPSRFDDLGQKYFVTGNSIDIYNDNQLVQRILFTT